MKDCTWQFEPWNSSTLTATTTLIAVYLIMQPLELKELPSMFFWVDALSATVIQECREKMELYLPSAGNTVIG